MVNFRWVGCTGKLVRCQAAGAKGTKCGHAFKCPLLLQWHRTATTQETDGFQVKRPGDVNVRCTVLLMLDYQVRCWE